MGNTSTNTIKGIFQPGQEGPAGTFYVLVCVSLPVYSCYEGFDRPSHSKLPSLYRRLSAASLAVQLLESEEKTNEQERRSNWRGRAAERPAWLEWSGADNNAIRLCETA